MPRKVHIVTTSGFPADAQADENRARALRCVEAAGRRGADLVCLPEGYVGRKNEDHPEQIPGKTFDGLAGLARQYGLWVVAGIYASEAANTAGIRNYAVVIDRRGELAGCYAKVHPTIEECKGSRIIPGAEPAVVDTDFGRIGLAICYDIGWPGYWADLARHGAELVIWISAYDGGFPLSCYAWNHHYQIVSSVRTDYAKVIDIAGSVVASTNSWHSMTDSVIDLESELFHADYNEEQIPRIESEMGERVTVKAFGEERFFILESNDPEWPVARIKTHYGLEGFREYHARATSVQEEYRGRS
jgi:beta-ureidopropionase